MKLPSAGLWIRRLALALSLAGAVLVPTPSEILRFVGFGMWIGANAYWLHDAVWREDSAQQALWAFYLLTAASGFFWILWGWTPGL